MPDDDVARDVPRAVEVLPAPEARDGFKTVVAVLIAMVTVIGALVAWRAALASSEASDAHFAGLAASLDREEALTVTTTNFYQHYLAYTDFVRNKELAEQLDREAASTGAGVAESFEVEARLLELLHRRDDAYDAVSVSQHFFVTSYLDEFGSYDARREFGESWAEATRRSDLNPDPHFAQVDRLQTKSNLLVAVLIILAVSLWFYTLAEGLDSSAKYAAALPGVALMVIGFAAALAVELVL